MTAFVTAGVGFLISVLWVDLMHDVLGVRRRGEVLPAGALDSIATYYRRVTVDAYPMNRLVAVVMAATLGGLVAEITTGGVPAWTAWTCLVLAGSAVGLAGLRTVQHAQRLGRRGDDPAAQTLLARSVGRDHLCCLVATVATLVIQLGFAR
jgi:hypothetical protein